MVNLKQEQIAEAMMQEQDFNTLFMKRAYFAINFAASSEFKELLAYTKKELLKINIELFIFVANYHFRAGEEVLMMQKAFEEIDKSDFLIAELTHKSIGAGIEMGYAYSTDKPIIYIRENVAKTSSTALGIASYDIVYTNKEELFEKLKEIFINKTFNTS